MLTMSTTLTTRSRMFIAGIATLGALGMFSLAALPAPAQLQPGDPRKIYPGADQAVRKGPPPNPNFTHGVRVLPGGNYYGSNGSVIILNGSPCPAPGYYGGYVGGYGGGYGGYYGGYNTSGFSMGFNVGGVSLGYGQSNGYTTYNTVPPPVSYDYGYQQPVQPRTASRDYNSQVENTPRRTPPPLKTGEEDANDYYLNRKTSPLQKEPGLAQAIRDIETAFRNGDIRLLEKHLDTGGKLTLMSMGRTRRQLEVSSYIDMTKDAFANIKTASYALDKVEPASGGAWMAYGKHVLKADNGADQTFNVGFVLKKSTDENGVERWLITEVSADPAK